MSPNNEEFNTRGASRASEATIYITSPLHPTAQALAERTFARVIQEGKDGQGFSRAECLQQADGILMRLGVASAEDLQQRISSRLRIITRSGVGYDSIDPQGCRDRDIVVTNLPGANAQAVAELALTLALSLLRRVKEIDRRFISGEVLRSIHSLAPGLTGKTVGIVGMGNTARQFALLLRPFGCKLLVHSPTSSAERWTAEDPDIANSGDAPIEHERVDMDTILEDADVISLHCPLTPRTKNLIGEKELGMMKPTAVLVNTARGGVVDERALEKALQAGKLAGAGIDVWEIEPARGENLGGLGKMSNVICLPHLGASTEQVAESSTVRAVEILANFFDRGEVVHRVI